MFAAMADHFIRQIKIARDFYISQYGQINRASKKALKKNRFGAVVDMYLRALSAKNMSLFETDSGKKLAAYITSIVRIEEIKGSAGHSYSVAINKAKIDPKRNELNISKAAIEYEKARQMVEIHNNNALTLLLIRFESFLTDYFEWLIRKYPNKYLTEKSIKYSEIIKYNLDDLRKELSFEVANTIMSQPLEEWLKTIRSHKFDLAPLSDYLNNFTEIYYRRNLIVHNGGKVNRQYLAEIRKSEDAPPLGTKLITNKQYILKAFSDSMIIIYGLLYASLKCNSDDSSEYLEFLFNSGFEHMMEGDWSISLYIFGLLIKDNSQSEINAAMSQINYWISCKNIGQFDNVKASIKEKDFSAMDISIRMAKEILLENYIVAISLLDEAILTGMPPDVVETWPLFIQFRKTEYYEAFKKKYAKELEHQVISSENLKETDDLQSNELKHSFSESTNTPCENND